MDTFRFRPGSLPLLVSVPHAGTHLPAEWAARMTPAAQQLPDTDWFVDRLYDIPALDSASVLVAEMSRYLVDLNRPPDDQTLYPGQATTGLCPLTTFAGEPIYLPGMEPHPDDIAHRLSDFWAPYHAALESELARLLAEYGRVLLLDAHSIASRVPRLFDGQLPDWNFGTNHGHSCGRSLQQRIESFARELAGYTSVVNGRFVGGYITRHYGQPDRGVQAVQLELSQATYLNETDGSWNHERAEALRQSLSIWIETLADFIVNS